MVEKHKEISSTEIEILKLNQKNLNSSIDKIISTLEKFSDKFDIIMKNLEKQIRLEEKIITLDKDINKLESSVEESIKYRQKVEDLSKSLDKILDDSQKNKFWIFGILSTLLIFILTFSITQIFSISSKNNIAITRDK